MAMGYRVTDVNMRTRYTAGGRERTYYDIRIETDRGATGYVRIEAADYNPERVQEILEDLYQRLEQPFEL